MKKIRGTQSKTHSYFSDVRSTTTLISPDLVSEWKFQVSVLVAKHPPVVTGLAIL